MKIYRVFLIFLVVFTILFTGILFAQDTGIGIPELPGLITLLLGALSPLLITLIKNYVPAKNIRWVIAYGLSFITGIGAMLIEKVDFNVTNIVIWIPLVFTYTQIAYRLFWHKLDQKITNPE